MYIQVRLLKGFPQPLWYSVNTGTSQDFVKGTIVQVPLRTQIVPALILRTNQSKPNVSFAIREIKSLEPFPADTTYHSFIKKLSDYYCLEPITLIKRIANFLQQDEKKSALVPPSNVDSDNKCQDVQLTDEQQKVCDFVLPHIQKNSYVPTLLHGVTGSGKTEVYKRLIIETIASGKTAVLLLPEVSIAMQIEKLLKAQLPSDMLIYGFHSAVTPKTKKIIWQLLLSQKPCLLIGVHLPILLPIANLGLIIIDEEHESGYQEKKHPKINSKEAALLRARCNNIPILLGSATPSVQSLYNVRTKGWHFFQLKKRFSGSFPSVETVLLSDQKQRRSFWITSRLEYEIKKRLQKKEQVIIFLNRRGYSFFVQCKECSFTFTCPACSVSLTYHSDNKLSCHYCDFSMVKPNCCPGCKADEKKLLKKGIGTQQVVSILEHMLPYARIGRADFDVTSKKNVWKQTIADFENGTIDILVGTQTITKGFHFPRVTLVGILWADLNLHFPVYNATETTLQQLIQVAGRAGRACEKSLVIVQTMSDHPVFSYLNETNYLRFYTNEIQQRKEVNYPPCCRLAEIEMKHTDEHCLETESMKVTQFLMQQLTKTKGVTILGPAKPPVYKVKNTFIRKIYLKGCNIQDLHRMYTSITFSSYKSSIFFTPNPL